MPTGSLLQVNMPRYSSLLWSQSSWHPKTWLLVIWAITSLQTLQGKYDYMIWCPLHQFLFIANTAKQHMPERATLPVCGIFNEKKQGKSLLTSKDVVLDWFSLRPSYILPKVVHSFVPFQFLPFRLFGCKAGPESFTTTLQVFIPPKFYWTLLLELR